ncbi:MAG TPA: hypothetical protein VEQ58_10705, partial [Polyangiaceae bacterium]|nr:hypothetical protein [Polyangiaceae bacterium]
MPASALPLRLERWSRGHAIVLSSALAVALWLGKPWPIGVAALGSFAVLLWQTRGEWTPSGR